MSRLNYILSRHRTQSRTFAYIINSWYACLPLIWFGKTLEIFWIQTICKFWKQVRERERERERERVSVEWYGLSNYIPVVRIAFVSNESLGESAHLIAKAFAARRYNAWM